LRFWDASALVPIFKAADALQLAAALVLWRDQSKGRTFVTADERLADAALDEGFDVLVPA
jgi:predicted nucleic acid-binding protein